MRRALCACLLAGAFLPSMAFAAEPGRPQGVSPGSPSASQALATSCPTFSWSGIAAARGYQLAVYEVGSDAELRSLLEVEVSGDARAWSPAAAQCPDSGKRYAWAVRARLDGGVSGWSDALLFETTGMPSDDEVRRALLVLQRFREGEGRRGEGERDGSVFVAEGGAEAALDRAPRVSAAEVGGPRPSLNSPMALSAETVGALSSPQKIPSSVDLTLEGSIDLGGYVFSDGMPFIHHYGGKGYGNTAVGLDALEAVRPVYAYGSFNSAFGTGALEENHGGSYNTAVGHYALNSLNYGRHNTAVGVRALSSQDFGDSNTAIGSRALRANTDGYSNTAIGTLAMLSNTTGSSNTAVGRFAGRFWETGDNNIAIGDGAFGEAGDDGTIRIGGNGYQTRTFIEGIRDAHGTGFDQAVCTNSADQLGPCSPSSLRFKQDVETMADTSVLLRALRPVTFRFAHDESGEVDDTLHYGLIAEEVARVLPTLVSHDGNGKPVTVRYSMLTPLLINELRRQDRELVIYREEVEGLRRRLERLARRKRFGPG